MCIVLAFQGLAQPFMASGSLGIVKRGAVGRSGLVPIGACRDAVDFAYAFVCEMISCGACGDGACAILADAGRCVVSRVAVHALRAAMVILIDTGIVIKAFVVGAFADNAFPILAEFIVGALRVTCAAVPGITFELFFWHAHRFCVGTAVCHAVIAGIGALSLCAAAGFGGFLVGTAGAAGAAVIRIAAVYIDTEVLVISRAERFRFILARGKNALAIDTVLEFRAGDETAACGVCAAEFCARVGIDARAVADHFARAARVLAFPQRADLFITAFGVDGTACVVGVFLADRSLFVVLKGAGNMVSGIAFFSKALFAEAVPALPARHLGAVIGMCAAVCHIIGLAFASKEMFCVFALDLTRACFIIALRGFFACLRDFPFFSHAFGKCVFVACPGVVCTFGLVNIARACFGIAQGVLRACLIDFPFSRHTSGKRVAVTFPCVVGAFGCAAWHARFCVGIALGIAFALINSFPFSGYAFGKCIFITFPCVICASGGTARFA